MRVLGVVLGQARATEMMCIVAVYFVLLAREYSTTLLFDELFAAVLHVVRMPISSSAGEGITANLVPPEEDCVGGETERCGRIRKAVWGMLCADDASVVSKPPEGRTKTMTVIVTGCTRGSRSDLSEEEGGDRTRQHAPQH